MNLWHLHKMLSPAGRRGINILSLSFFSEIRKFIFLLILMLKVNFVNRNLEYLYTDPDSWKWYYPPAVIRNYIKLVTLMQSVETLLEINTYWWYKIAPKKWNMKWIWAARLNDTWRLEFTVDNYWNVQVINLERISNHYA